MDSALLGFLIVAGVLHLLFVVIPLMSVVRAPISTGSKLAWCVILLCLPFVGVAIMHFKYGIGLFQGRLYEISAAEERARSGTLAPRDDD